MKFGGNFGSIPRGARLTCALACVFACLFAPLAAQGPKPTEYQVKAAYLSNLGRYLSWSNRAKPSAEEPFELCVLGTDPFGPALDAAVTGESIGGAMLTARRINRPQDALNCRVLFVSSSETGQWDTVRAALGTASVLTVADIPDFLKRGGMIQFVLDGNRVRFEINIAASGRVGLSLSSELLKLARAVRRTP